MENELKTNNTQGIKSQLILAQIYNFHQFSSLLNEELATVTKDINHMSSVYSLWLNEIKEIVSSSILDNKLQMAFNALSLNSPIENKECNQDIELKQIKIDSNAAFKNNIENLLQSQKRSAMKRRNCYSVDNYQEWSSSKMIKIINNESDEKNIKEESEDNNDNNQNQIQNMDTIFEQPSREEEKGDILSKAPLTPIMDELKNMIKAGDLNSLSHNESFLSNSSIHNTIKVTINKDNKLSIVQREGKETAKAQFEIEVKEEGDNNFNLSIDNYNINSKKEKDNQKEQNDIKTIKSNGESKTLIDSNVNENTIKQFRDEIDKATPQVTNKIKQIKNTPSFIDITPIQPIKITTENQQYNDELTALTQTISGKSTTDFTFAKQKQIKITKPVYGSIQFQSVKTNPILPPNSNIELDSIKKSPPQIKKWTNPYNQTNKNNGNNNTKSLFPQNPPLSTLTKNLIDPEYEITDDSGSSDEEGQEIEIFKEIKHIPKWVKSKRFIEDAILKQSLSMSQFKPLKVENLNLNMIFNTLNSNYNLRENSADWRLDNTIQSNPQNINDTFKSMSNENYHFFPQTNRQLNFSSSKNNVK